MKRLHWFVLKSYIGPFILTFFISLFLLLMQFLWKYIDDLVGKGLELSVIGELLFYISLSLVPMALPLAILLASLMTFGNMGENYELLSLKAAGISLQKTMQSLIIFTILVSIGAFFFANNVLPVANLKSRSLLWDVQRQKPDLQIKTGVFYNGLPGFSIRVEDKNQETNLLKNIRIYNHTDKRGNVSVTVADSGYMKMTEDEKNLLIILYNGYSYNEEKEDKKRRRREKTYPHRREEFKEQRFTIELTGFGLNRSDESLFKSNTAMLNLNQLKYFQDSIKHQLTETHTKYNTNLLKVNYFKKRNKIDRNLKHTIEIDTTRLRRDLRIDKNIKPALIPDSSKLTKNLPKPQPVDTIQKSKEPFDVYKAFNNLDPPKKTEVIYDAISMARGTKSYIDNNNVNLESFLGRLRKYKIEWHRKFTLSFACFIFFFIGAPLGAIIRKGGLGMPVIISVLFFIVYYIITISSYKLAKEGIMSPFLGMWLASMILLPTGMFLTYKATTDSVILNIETYTLFFKKIFNIKAKNLSDTETVSGKIFEEKLPPHQTVEEITTFNSKSEDFYILLFEEVTIKNILKNKIFPFKKELENYTKDYYSFFNLLSIQNFLENRHIRSLSQDLPTLEASEFNFLFINRILSIFLILFFPIGLLYYFLFFFKSKSLKRRIFKINEITKSIIKSVENDKEYQEILYENTSGMQ